MMARHSERAINGDDVRQGAGMGLDERAVKNGQRDCVAILTGRMATETVMVGVWPARQTSPVHAVRCGRPPPVRHTMHGVCAARYAGCVQAAPEVFGKRGKMLMDRFQVAQR